jgi:type IX secretion system PorP/SprF family membrane protein
MNKIFKWVVASYCLCMAGNSVFAQQEAQYSLYMFNQLLINPAVTGTEDYMDTKVGGRWQWTGIDNAPKNIYATFHTPIKKLKQEFDDVKPTAWHGVGGFVTAEVTGPINKYKLYGSYAYHIPLSSKYILSLGTFLGVQNYYVDKDKLNFGDNQADNALNGNVTAYSPDGSLGAWFYSKKLYAGLSVLQIFDNKIAVTDGTNSQGRLNRHYFFTTGYRIDLDENWMLVPSVLIKGLTPAPVQFDINMKVRYQNRIWGGLSYRNKDALVAMIGMTIDNKIDVGYAYDYSISSLNKYNYGSHEIMVGYRIPRKQAPPSHSYFW